jgi:tetratricopeptide (TPR) repeat protein
MDFLFSIPFLPQILVVVVLFVAYQQIASRVKIKTPGGAGGMDDILGKILPSYRETKLNRQIASYRKSGHTLAAGKLLEDAGRLPEATDAYLEGQEFFAAATTLEKMGKLEKAADYYLQSGDYKKAANVYIAAKKPAKAAQLFLEKGNSLEAARLFGVADQWDKAAEPLQQGRATRCARRRRTRRRRSGARRRSATRSTSWRTSPSARSTRLDRPSVDQKSALQAGRLYERAGQPAKALQIYTRGNYFKEAADVCMRQGQYAKAAELYLRRRRTTRWPADAYEKGGERVKAANLRGEVALKSEKIPEAARHFLEGQDYQRSAELFEQVGMLPDAAGAYEAAESWAAAGGVYIRAGHKDLAAQCYERAGELETAAKLYEESGQPERAIPLFEKAGLTFKSGEAAAAAGDRDRAISLLQRVPANDENFRGATEILARLFLESGRAPLAIDRLQRAIAGQPVSIANIDLIYWLAVAQEKDQPAEALALYKKIQAEHLGFKDVDDRVAALEAGKADRLRPASGDAAAQAGRGAADGEAVDRRAASARPGAVARRPRTRGPAPGRHCSGRFRGAGRSGRGVDHDPGREQGAQGPVRPARGSGTRPAGHDLPRGGPARRPQRGHARAARRRPRRQRRAQRARRRPQGRGRALTPRTA